jgi:hypothetical protein
MALRARAGSGIHNEAGCVGIGGSHFLKKLQIGQFPFWPDQIPARGPAKRRRSDWTTGPVVPSEKALILG